MLLMFELGIRGEITQAVHRYAKASNKHTSDSEGSIKASNSILDANDLDGWAMSQKLPIGEFYWVDPGEFTPDKTDTVESRFNEPPI